MSTTTYQQPAAPTQGVGRTPSAHVKNVSFGGNLKAEWIKFSSLRSTWWSIGIMIVMSIGLSAIVSATLNPEMFGGTIDETTAKIFAVQSSAFSLAFTGLIAAVLGVLVISGEYSTGMIRSTFTAVPKRTAALVAKIFILFGVLLIVGVISIVGGFILTSGLREANGFGVGLMEPGVLGALFSGALYLGLIGVMAFGFGALVRSAAGGIAISVGVLMVLPILVQIMNQFGWGDGLQGWLPANAGSAIYSIQPPVPGGGTAGMEYWQSLLILIGWVLIAVVPALVLAKRRDA